MSNKSKKIELALAIYEAELEVQNYLELAKRAAELEAAKKVKIAMLKLELDYAGYILEQRFADKVATAVEIEKDWCTYEFNKVTKAEIVKYETKLKEETKNKILEFNETIDIELTEPEQVEIYKEELKGLAEIELKHYIKKLEKASHKEKDNREERLKHSGDIEVEIDLENLANKLLVEIELEQTNVVHNDEIEEANEIEKIANKLQEMVKYKN